MQIAGIKKKYFSVRIISAPLGFRKPDPRLFQLATESLGITPEEAIYVGNDMYRDVYGANRAGLHTIFVDSDQGAKTWENVQPDYYARNLLNLSQVAEGVHFLTRKFS